MSSKTLKKSLEYVRDKRPVMYLATVAAGYSIRYGSGYNILLLYLLTVLILSLILLLLTHTACSMLLHAQVMVILENVHKRATEDIVTAELQKLNYVTQAFTANSASYGLPQSRTRLYILAIDASQAEIIHGPPQWRMWLEDLWNKSAALSTVVVLSYIYNIYIILYILYILYIYIY